MAETGSFQKLFASFSADNPVFSGGFGLAVLAGGAQLLKSGYQVGFRMLKRHFLVTLEVTSKDRSYPWVLQWLSLQGGARTQHLSVETTFKPVVGNAANMSFDLVPGPGQHFLNYKGRFMLVQRAREQSMVDLNTGKPWEKVVFTSYGRNTTVFDEMLSEAYSLSVQKEEGKTIIFTNWGSEWRQFGQPRRRRTLDSVILDYGVSNKLLADVEEWIHSSKWYSERGIPYRRGYLLYGPPGSGKSSFIFALAGKLGYNICILNLAERGLTDDRLALALSCIPPQSIVLLEDIDAAFPSREDKFDPSSHNLQHTSDVTFSGLLNVLDGVAASEERLIFMTTNHIERLDPALIRPGRVDFVQLVDDATDYQVKELFKRFYPVADEELYAEFLQQLRSITPKISMAALQGFFLRNKDDALKAIANVSSILENANTSRHTISATSMPHKQPRGPVKPRPVKPLTIEQVDKMYFNPQPGWDQNL